jgi:hypothetical protein
MMSAATSTIILIINQVAPEADAASKTATRQETDRQMSEKCKFRSSRVVTFAFTIFIPFVIFVLFLQVIDNTVIYFITFGWLILLFLVHNIKIYEDRIVVSRLFLSKTYRIDELKSAYQTFFFSPKLCFIVFKKGFKKFIIFLPVPEVNDILLLKDEDSILFLRNKISEQKNALEHK